ncbi:cell division protein FtsX [Pilimelia terevasa]|uniref:Cell division protein FtsX n=1 Tax=Pilimelia terevasa TaxID=53372 RepID=A0A8J3FEG7_9ACTN|nr:permease-like cell division protein FtsX [Pilimelia terevasa]GGK15561.1 cell division protein FtsX [Pilimelia terevasa]
MRAKYVLSEVLVGLWRNVTMTVAMIITMAVSLTMVGASYIMYRQVGQMEEYYYAKLEVSIFLSPTVTEEQRLNLRSQLDGDPLVRAQDTVHETREMALENFKRIFSDAPDLVSAVTAQDLPESYRVKLKDPQQFEQVFNRYNGQPGIDQIVDQRRLLDKIFKILGAVQKLALVAATVMALAALMLVGNTIQVAAFNKRREVAVMKLVGASNWFIQSPFVLEAVFAGLFGSILAFLALVAAQFLLFQGSLQSLTELLTPVNWSTVWEAFGLMTGVGALVSAVTAWVTLRFYLRV